jgi:Fe-S-cluster containining protein
LSGNERLDLCADCGGQCCRSRPGVEAPERFLAAPDPTAALAAALATGDWVLADHVGVPWVDGVEPPEDQRRRLIRYPRPATLLERGQGGMARDELAPCTFLGEAGCRLGFDDRPRMCRALRPAPGFECEGDWGRREAALAWLPHQGWVATAAPP